jgi:hypothetical protein
MGQVFDMRKRDDLKRIAINIQNPHEILQKVINAIKVGTINREVNGEYSFKTYTLRST